MEVIYSLIPGMMFFGLLFFRSADLGGEEGSV